MGGTRETIVWGVYGRFAPSAGWVPSAAQGQRRKLGAGVQPLLLPPAHSPGTALSEQQQHTLGSASRQFSPGAAENPAGGRWARRTGQRGAGGPWLSSAGLPGSAAPAGPGAAPCASGAWTAGRWCGSVAGTAQAGKRRLLVPGAGVVVCGRCPLPEGRYVRSRRVGRSRTIRPPLAPALRAAKGVRPSVLSPSPPGELQGGGPARKLARPPRQSAPLSPTWQRSAAEPSCWVAIPALRGCQPMAGDHGGSAPKPPGAAVPRGSA